MPSWANTLLDSFLKPAVKRAGITGRVPYVQTHLFCAIIWAGWIAKALS
jgi:hypothetical protein